MLQVRRAMLHLLTITADAHGLYCQLKRLPNSFDGLDGNPDCCMPFVSENARVAVAMNYGLDQMHSMLQSVESVQKRLHDIDLPGMGGCVNSATMQTLMQDCGLDPMTAMHNLPAMIIMDIHPQVWLPNDQ
jgi:hypothetical protein